MQVVVFKQNFGEQTMGIGYALSYIFSEKDTSALFGFGCGNPIKIWLNDQLFHFQKSRKLSAPKEISYNRFVFQDTLILNLKKGMNKILVKSIGERDNGTFFLRAITPDGDENSDVKFYLQSIATEITSSNWLCIGVFPGDNLDKIYPPELEFKNFYMYAVKIFYWTIPK